MSVYTHLMTLVLISTLHGRVHAGRIIGGHEAVPHSRPYMALVIQRNASGTIGYCGGFLVNEEFVMTAAHCRAESYTVQLGVDNIHKSNETQSHSVAQSFPHEDFDNKTFESDIMLLKLSTKAWFSRNVAPISLADKGVKGLPRSCSISGWGSTSVKPSSLSQKLMEVDVSLLDKLPPMFKHVYCSKGRTGPGSGDSGGPLVCGDGRAYGVVSGTFSPCDGDPISCFVRIPYFRTWADQITGSK